MTISTAPNGVWRTVRREEQDLHVRQGRERPLDERPDVRPGEAAVAAAQRRDRHGLDLTLSQYAYQVDEAGLDVR